MCSFTSASHISSACASVLTARNSTPFRPASTIRVTAFVPPPPTPTHLDDGEIATCLISHAQCLSISSSTRTLNQGTLPGRPCQWPICRENVEILSGSSFDLRPCKRRLASSEGSRRGIRAHRRSCIPQALEHGGGDGELQPQLGGLAEPQLGLRVLHTSTSSSMDPRAAAMRPGKSSGSRDSASTTSPPSSGRR